MYTHSGIILTQARGSLEWCMREDFWEGVERDWEGIKKAHRCNPNDRGLLHLVYAGGPGFPLRLWEGWSIRP